MRTMRKLARMGLLIAIAAGVVAPAGATTLVRQSLEDLVAANSRIVVGEVVDTYSYWNKEKNFILTDVRFSVTEVIKGAPRDTELKLTILGGEVGDLATVIIGGAELIPGHSYVLFLSPGTRGYGASMLSS
jgi:hypothetical protein